MIDVAYVVIVVLLGVIVYLIAQRHFATQSESKKQKVLGGFKEAVVVTNRRLQIISLNQGARDVLSVNIDQVFLKPVFSWLQLKDVEGKTLDYERAVGIDEMRKNCEPKAFEQVQFYSKKLKLHTEVQLQINPVCNEKGKVTQFVFVMRRYVEDENQESIEQKLGMALVQHQELLRSLRYELARSGLPQQQQSLERFSEVQRDLLTMIEVEQPMATGSFEVVDVVSILQIVIKNTQKFSSSFDVHVSFEKKESTSSPYSFDTPKGVHIEWDPKYSESTVVLTQARWLRLLFEKVIDLAVLVSVKQDKAVVKVEYEVNEHYIDVHISSQFRALSESESEKIFHRDYGHLGKTSFLLHLGSGLEGYLAKKVAEHLGYELSVRKIGESTPLFGMSLRVWRNPR